MRRLIFSDVHANRFALEAVLNASGAVDEYVFLGDAVGYGSDPQECLRALMQLHPLHMVLGNHDQRVLKIAASFEGASEPTPAAVDSGKAWDVWTACQLDSASLDFMRRQSHSLELTMDGLVVSLVHNLPGAVSYVVPETPLAELERLLQDERCDLAFFGHSHVAFDRNVGAKVIVNPGSVGQQRDGHAAASFAIWDECGIQLCRVPYDVEASVRQLQAMPMERRFRERWIHNLRFGLVV